MSKEKSVEEYVNKLRELYIDSYKMLYEDNDHRKHNTLVKKSCKIEELLVISDEGIKAMSVLLDDKSDIVRYYSASALVSLFPKKCIKILKNIEESDLFVACLVKYVIMNYESGNNYIEKFLNEQKGKTSL